MVRASGDRKRARCLVLCNVSWIPLQATTAAAVVLFSLVFSTCDALDSWFVSTIAGGPPFEGHSDGVGTLATFRSPTGVTFSSSEKALVTDQGNNLIRIVDLDSGNVFTVAGVAGVSGYADGSGSAATFDLPWGISVALNADPVPFAVIADSRNCLIRRLELNGAVSTVAGVPRHSGYADGVGSTATFGNSTGIALSAAGTFALIADSATHLIRRLDLASGTVTTLAGAPYTGGTTDGVGSLSSFSYMTSLAMDAAGLFALVVGPSSGGVIRRINISSADVSSIALNWTSPCQSIESVSLSSDGSVALLGASDAIVLLNISTGAASLLAGNPCTSGRDDGPGLSATFSGNPACAIDPVGGLSSGRIVVVDKMGGSIRTMSRDPQSCVEGWLQHETAGLSWPAWRRDPSHAARSLEPLVTPTAWRFKTQGAVQSSPALSGNTLFIGSDDSRAYAIDLVSGTMIGSFQATGAVFSSPAVGMDGTVFFGSHNNFIAANVGSGHRWIFSGLADFDTSPAIGNDGTIFFGGSNSMFYALNGSTGRLRWSFLVGGVIRSSPALSSDHAVVYFGCDDGYVYALRASDGALHWNSSVSAYGVWSSPALINRTIIVGSIDGAVYALDAGSGAQIWRYVTQGAIASSPAIGGTIVVVGSTDSRVYAIHADTGALRWIAQTGGPVWSSPAIDDDGIIYIGSDDNRLYALDPCSGAVLWSFLTGGPVRSSPAVSGGAVFVGSLDSFVYALARVPAGYAFNASGAVVPCPAGHYCIGGYEMTTACPVGKFRSLEGATSSAECLSCKIGTHTVSAGLASCSGGPQEGAPWPLRGYDAAHTSRSTFPPTPNGWAFTASGLDVGAPVLGLGGTVYVRCSGTVFALRSSLSGALLWQRSVPFSVVIDTLGLSAVAIAANGDVYVGSTGVATGSAAGTVLALDGTTGSVRWSNQVGYAVYSAPAIGADGTVYCTCGDSRVYAMRPDEGLILWTFRTPSGTGGFIGSPVLGRSAVFVASANSFVYALDPSTGNQLWEFATSAEVYCAPALWTTASEEAVFVGSLDAYAYALNGSTGALLWKYATAGPIYAHASVGSDGTAYFGSTGGVYALAGTTGELLWSYTVDGGIFGFALGPGRSVFFSGARNLTLGGDAVLGELDGETGELRWSRSIRGLITAPVLATDGSLFFSARDVTKSYVIALVPAQPGFSLNLVFSPFVGQSVGLTSLCPIGHFCIGGFAAAEPCPPGQYSSLQGSAACTPCPAGTYNMHFGATAVAQCTPCALGSVSSAIGANSSSVCTVCGPGNYGNLGATTCSECPRGTYFNGTGGSSVAVCIAAAVGETVPQPGSSSPELCGPGTYSDVPGSTSCRQCPRGLVAESSGSSACTPCPPGYASPVTGGVACSACGIGTYAEGNGSSACTACPAGYFLDAIAATAASACQVCPAGRFNTVPGQGSSSCLACPAGTASAAQGAISEASCQLCASGSYSAGGAAACSSCPAGSFAPGPGSASCTLCPLGTYASASGSTACRACPLGTTTFASGAYQCIAGAYSCGQGLEPSDPLKPPAGPGDCVNVTCKPPLVGTGGGCSSLCPPGSFSDAASAMCMPCPSGRVCVGVLASPYFADASTWSSSLSTFVHNASASARRIAVVPAQLCAFCTPQLAIDVIARANENATAGTLLYPAVTAPNDIRTLLWAVPTAIALFIGVSALCLCLVAYTHHVRPLARVGEVTVKVLKFVDMYKERHYVHNGDAVIARSTALGGTCTLTGLGIIAALASSLLYDYTSNNVSELSAILPVDLTTAPTTITYEPQTFSPPGWPTVPGFALIVIAQGHTEGDCMLDPATTISGLAPGSGSAQLSSVAYGNTHVNVITCPGCLFGPTSAVSTSLRYSCQNIVLGAVAVNATGGAVLSAANATARPGERLAGVSWTLTPLIELRRDLTSRAPLPKSRGVRVIGGQHDAEFVSLSGDSAVIVPNAASISLTLTLTASPFYVFTSVSQSSTLTQLFSSLIALSGVVGGFALLFKYVERFMHDRTVRVVDSVSRRIPRRRRRTSGFSAGDAPTADSLSRVVISPGVTPAAAVCDAGDVEITGVTLVEGASAPGAPAPSSPSLREPSRKLAWALAHPHHMDAVDGSGSD